MVARPVLTWPCFRCHRRYGAEVSAVLVRVRRNVWLGGLSVQIYGDVGTFRCRRCGGLCRVPLSCEERPNDAGAGRLRGF
jgi:hypothetical protein